MESRLVQDAERALVEATQRLSPEKRLNAFLTHCRLMMELYEAGRKLCGQHRKRAVRRRRPKGQPISSLE